MGNKAKNEGAREWYEAGRWILTKNIGRTTARKRHVGFLIPAVSNFLIISCFRDLMLKKCPTASGLTPHSYTGHTRPRTILRSIAKIKKTPRPSLSPSLRQRRRNISLYLASRSRACAACPSAARSSTPRSVSLLSRVSTRLLNFCSDSLARSTAWRRC